MQMRCKFACTELTQKKDRYIAKLSPVWSGSEHSDSFYSCTPESEVELHAVREMPLKVGAHYYLDIMEAPSNAS